MRWSRQDKLLNNSLKLTEVDMRYARKILANRPGVKYIIIDHGYKSLEWMEWLVGLLLQNDYITSISLDGCNLSDEAVMQLTKCKRLKVLELPNNNIGDKGVAALLMMPNLRILYLVKNCLTNEGAELVLGQCGEQMWARITFNRRVDKKIIEMVNEKSKLFIDDGSITKIPAVEPSFFGDQYRNNLPPVVLEPNDKSKSTNKRDTAASSPVIRHSPSGSSKAS